MMQDCAGEVREEKGGRCVFSDKQRASKIWKGTVWGAAILNMGARRSLGDGRSISF